MIDKLKVMFVVLVLLNAQLQSSAQILVHFAEFLNHTVLQLWSNDLDRIDNVIDKSLALLIVKHLSPKYSRLIIIAIPTRVESVHIASRRESTVSQVAQLDRPIKRIWMVVRGPTLIVAKCHQPVSLSVVRPCTEGTIDGQLLIVGAQTMELCVFVGEETSLKHFVR